MELAPATRFDLIVDHAKAGLDQPFGLAARLNDLGKLDEELYLQIKFGTTNQDKIRLMNFGVNSFLAGKLIDNYADFVDLEPDSGVLKLRPELIDQMRQNRENEILVFEAGMHLGLAHEV